MSIIRTLRGQNIDMEALFIQNEKTIAVTGGGQSVNARGDRLGPGGVIIKKVEKIQEEYDKVKSTSLTQKISLSDYEKFRKILNKKSYMTEDEVKQFAAEKMVEEKKKAQQKANRIQLQSALQGQSEPIIVNHTNEIVEHQISKVVEEPQEKTPKKKRKIVDE